MQTITPNEKQLIVVYTLYVFFTLTYMISEYIDTYLENFNTLTPEHNSLNQPILLKLSTYLFYKNNNMEVETRCLPLSSYGVNNYVFCNS